MINNATIDTIITESRTINQTKTIVLTDHKNETITHQTPTFRIQPTPGVTLTVQAGPTYVIYRDLYGAVDHEEDKFKPLGKPISSTVPKTCRASPTPLVNWQPKDKEDWNYFILTYTQNLTDAQDTRGPVLLPSKALQYLKNNLAIQSQFHGSDIASCTVKPFLPAGNTFLARPTSKLSPEFSKLPPAPDRSPIVAPESPMPGATSVPAFFSRSTGTFISTTYDTTSTYVTRAGCLRCQDTAPPPGPTPDEPQFSNKIIIDVGPTPSDTPDISRPDGSNKPDESNKPDGSITPDGSNKPGDGMNDVGKAQNSAKPNDQPRIGVPIVIGSSTYTATPVQQTPRPNQPGEQNAQPLPPVIVIGTHTLTLGASTKIDGVAVVVPLPTPGSDDTPRVIVNGNTVPVLVAANAYPTPAPILMVGSNTVTANAQGQFVVGTQTLKPGGPAVVVDGSTLSLASAGGVAIVNGVTRTLANAPVITAAPVLSVGGRVVSATVVGGTTQYVVGNQNLVPGSSVVVDGTTYALPAASANADGKIIVNGVTSSLNPAPSAFLLGQQSLCATVISGTTQYILGTQTLLPGSSVVVSGTTYALPAASAGSGGKIVVNGATSTLTPAPSSFLLGATYITARVSAGTTSFVFSPSQTLTPGGAVTISGTTFSMPLSASGSAVVINGVTSTLPPSAVTTAMALTLNGKTYTPTTRAGTTEFVLAPGVTLRPGEKVTVSGTTLSLDAMGTALVVNGVTSSVARTPAKNSASTTAVMSSSSTVARDVGGFVWSGIGGGGGDGGASASRSSGVGAQVRVGGLDKWVEGLVVGIAGWVVLLL
jgi:hypothetical protein